MTVTKEAPPTVNEPLPGVTAWWWNRLVRYAIAEKQRDRSCPLGGRSLQRMTETAKMERTPVSFGPGVF